MTKHIELNHSLEKYIIDHSSELNPVLKEIIDYNLTLGDKKKLQISISQAHFLQTLIKISNIKKILEIGSFTGFSALSMALALPSDGFLVSLDKDHEISNKAKSFYEKAKEKKIKQMIKPAFESLKELKKSKQIFDLIFIDADKENYINYYDFCMDLIEKKGVIIIDNVLWHGEVVDEKNNEEFTINIRKFNKFVSEDKRVEQIIIPLGDGMTVCRIL